MSDDAIYRLIHQLLKCWFQTSSLSNQREGIHKVWNLHKLLTNGWWNEWSLKVEVKCSVEWMHNQDAATGEGHW